MLKVPSTAADHPPLPMFLRAPPTPSQVAGTSARARMAAAAARPDSDTDSDDADTDGCFTAAAAQPPAVTLATRVAREERVLARKGSRGQIADASSAAAAAFGAKPVAVAVAVAAAAPTPQRSFREGHRRHGHGRRMSEEPPASQPQGASEASGSRGEAQSFGEAEALEFARKESGASSKSSHRHHHHHHHHRSSSSKRHHRHHHHRSSSSKDSPQPQQQLVQLVQAAAQLPEALPALTPSPMAALLSEQPIPAVALQQLHPTVAPEPGTSAAEMAVFASEWRGPRAAYFAQYALRRTKGGMLARDVYEVLVEATGQVLLRAKRRIKGGSPEYTIAAVGGQQRPRSPSPRQEEQQQQQQNPQAEVYCGTLRANMRRTEFLLSDGAHAVRGEVVYAPDKTADDPRGVRVLLSDDHCQTLLVNKMPDWSERLQSFVLDFNGRVKLPSIKNFQLARSGNSPDVLFQFGKISETAFALDFKHPFTLLQAFGIAITAFN